MRILITGFEPFGCEQMNPSFEAIQLLPATICGGAIIKAKIPTVFGKATSIMEQLIEQHQPDIVINVGQAGGRNSISFERIAINIDDAKIPDNEGNQPLDCVIQKNGASAYFTQLPIKAMLRALTEEGIPATVSNTAGTFVCNHIMYQVQYLIQTRYPTLQAGFIHVPYVLEQKTLSNQAAFFLPLETIAAGIKKAIATIIEYQNQSDIKEVGGQLH